MTPQLFDNQHVIPTANTNERGRTIDPLLSQILAADTIAAAVNANMGSLIHQTISHSGLRNDTDRHHGYRD